MPTDTAAVVDAAPGAKLVWVETPSNPGLDVVDIRAVADACRRHPRGRQHAGHAARPAAARARRRLRHGERHEGAQRPQRPPARLRRRTPTSTRCGRRAASSARSRARSRSGSRTARSRRSTCGSSASARTRCGWRRRSASTCPCATPGLPGDPAHEIAARQMDRFGPVLCFTLPDARGRRRIPRGGGPRHRGDELRRHAHDRRAARALGRRRRAGGLHPAQRRLRGPRRAGRRRDARVGAGARARVGSTRA